MDGNISTPEMSVVQEEVPANQKDASFTDALSPSNVQITETQSPETTQLSPDEEAMRKQIEMMQAMQARQEISMAQKGQESGGEAIAGVTQYEEPNFTSTINPEPQVTEEDIMTKMKELQTAFAETPEGKAQIEAAVVADPHTIDSKPGSYFKFKNGVVGNFFRTMEESGDIPIPGDGLGKTLVKSALLPINIVKTVIKSVWNGAKNLLRPIPRQAT
jgi:hypothetical protein